MGTSFDKQQVYDLLRKIPKGKVLTYGKLAEMLGDKRWARSVGNALHVNPDGEHTHAIKSLILMVSFLTLICSEE